MSNKESAELWQGGEQPEQKSVLKVAGPEWEWVKTQMNDGKIIAPTEAGVFMITLKEDGTITGKTDCNGFSGQYTMDDKKLSFGPFAATLMFCEGSQEGAFTTSLAEVESYFINENNELVLQLKMDSGVMIFSENRPAVEAPAEETGELIDGNKLNKEACSKLGESDCVTSETCIAYYKLPEGGKKGDAYVFENCSAEELDGLDCRKVVDSSGEEMCLPE